jgi:hypothetical protein
MGEPLGRRSPPLGQQITGQEGKKPKGGSRDNQRRNTQEQHTTEQLDALVHRHGTVSDPSPSSDHRRPPAWRGGSALLLRDRRAPVLPVPAPVVELLLQPRPEVAASLGRRPLLLLLLVVVVLLRPAARGQRRRLPPLLPQQQAQAPAAGARRLGRRQRDGLLPRRAGGGRRRRRRRRVGAGARGAGGRGRGGEARQAVPQAERAHARSVPVLRVPPAPRRVRLPRPARHARRHE